MLRQNFEDRAVDVEMQKKQAFSLLSKGFSHALYRRFIEIKLQIEDIWDLVNTKALLEGRLKVLAAKEVYTAKNLVDMALISCILWNGVEDPPEEPIE